MTRYQNWKKTSIKNDPKIMSTLNVRIEGKIENESCSITWVDPKTVVEPYLDPQTRPLGPKKTKMTKNFSQNKMSGYERNKENESCSTTWVDPKKAVDPYSNTKASPLRPQKDKND